MMGIADRIKSHHASSGSGKKPPWVQRVGQTAIMGTMGRATSHHGYNG